MVFDTTGGAVLVEAVIVMVALLTSLRQPLAEQAVDRIITPDRLVGILMALPGATVLTPAGVPKLLKY